MTVSASTFNVPLEALADRTAYLRQRLASHVPGADNAGFTSAFMLAPIATFVDKFEFLNGPFCWQQNNVSTAGSLIIPLPRPPTGKILEIQAYVKGEPGHAGAFSALGTKPKVDLYRQDILMTGSGTLVDSVTDSSGSYAVYEAGHQIVITTDHTLVSTDFYYLLFSGETGANSQVGLKLSGFALYWGPV